MSTLKVTNIESPSGGGVNAKITDINGGQLSNRNLIINGDMRIAQRGTSFSTNNDRNFGVDRFACNASANTTITYSQETDAPAGFSNSLKATITSANSSRQAGDTNYVLQAIEGYNSANLNFGSSNAKTFTLSFYVKSSVTGTYGIGFANNGSTRVRHTSYTINSANTWERKTITVPGDTSGTWLTNSGIGLVPIWDLGMGTNYESDVIDTWDAGEDYRKSSYVNLSLTGSATWQLTGVQLEVGDVATVFEHRNITDEIAKCQRYYQNGACWIIGFGSTGAFVGSAQNFNTYMRANNPNVVLGTPSENVNFGSIGAPAVFGNGFRLFGTITTGTNINAYYSNTFTASAEL